VIAPTLGNPWQRTAAGSTRAQRVLASIRERVIAAATGVVTVSAGAGVLLVSMADQLSRQGTDILVALNLFWPGMLLIVAPAAYLLIQGEEIADHHVGGALVPAAAAGNATPAGAPRQPSLPMVNGSVSIVDARARGAGSHATVVGTLMTPIKALQRGRRTAMLDDGTDHLAIESRGRIRETLDAGDLVAITGTLVQRREGLALVAAPDHLRKLSERAVPIEAAATAPGERAESADPAEAVGGRRGDAAESHARGASVVPVLSRNERVAILLLVTLALYVVKVMISPLQLTGADEFTHWRTMEDILRTGHLFADNPLLRISPIYPGLETAAASASVTTGLDVFPIALVVIGVAKAITILAVFLIAASITGSNRVAGVASLVYMANPSFVTFDAAFSYESLAIPLALVAMWATLQWHRHGGRFGLHAALALAAIAATSVTHHLTSLVLLVLLVTWFVVWLARDRRRVSGRAIVIVTAWALACDAAWLAVAGTLALSYLSFIVQGGVQELVSILTGTREARQLFAPRPGLTTPPAEVVVAYGAVALLLLALPFMVRYALVRRRPAAIAVVLALAALLYPASLALRFTTLGAETSQRASEFLFLAIAIAGADWLLAPRGALRRFDWRPPSVLFAPILVVLFAGGLVAGAPLLTRLPGPYLVAAESRSIEPEGVDTAAWALEHLGPDNRLIADRTNAKLLGSIGLQFPVTSANEHVGTAYVMFARTLGPDQIDVMRQANVRYVIVDLRLSTDVPSYPFYFEQAEPDAGAHTTPIPIEALTKFEGRPGVLRVYDSGNIRIYDVQGLVDAPK
jgi:hypothetical protein